MRFGPFPHRDLERIEKTLSDANILYEVHHDEQLLQAQIEEWKSQPATATRGRALEPAADFVDIEDADLEKVGDKLEKFGVYLNVEEPDFDAIEDYYCVECDHHSEKPGTCPKHHTPLVDSATYKAKLEANADELKQASWKVAVGIAGAGAVGYLVWHFVG